MWKRVWLILYFFFINPYFEAVMLIKEWHQTNCDLHKEMIDSGVIARFVETFRISSPNLQMKIVSIFDYVVTSELHVTALIEASIELGLDVVLSRDLPMVCYCIYALFLVYI